MAEPGGPVPKPRPRKPRTLASLHIAQKRQLLDSFDGFNASTVSEDQIKCAREFIQGGAPQALRYEFVPYSQILKQNEVCV